MNKKRNDRQEAHAHNNRVPKIAPMRRKFGKRNVSGKAKGIDDKDDKALNLYFSDKCSSYFLHVQTIYARQI